MGEHDKLSRQLRDHVDAGAYHRDGGYPLGALPQEVGAEDEVSWPRGSDPLVVALVDEVRDLRAASARLRRIEAAARAVERYLWRGDNGDVGFWASDRFAISDALAELRAALHGDTQEGTR